jgi:SAM-dependent MidA family methyltransferase
MLPLERQIREMIAAEGPMRLDRYMGLCLGHPEHGYYMKGDPFGAEGDFITAPEVSQTFGELIGIWCVAAWQAMGAPDRFGLVELGPGRGTLMSDLLRAAGKAVPDFVGAAQVHLVETSPALRACQAKAIATAVNWHDSVASIPQGPMILVANEFFDAIPIRQFEKRDGRWHERVIGLREDRLVLGLVEADIGNAGQDGDIIEFAPERNAIARTIGERLAAAPGVALIIDYGHLVSAPGDTLQAIRAHGFVSILDGPGRADLTSHVDFAALGQELARAGATVHPALTQRAFLLAMGLEQRMAMLAARADPAMRAILERQTSRLAGANEMGNLFKVVSATSPGLAMPYPFGRR